MNSKFKDYERVRVKSNGHIGTIVETLHLEDGKTAYIIDDDIIEDNPDTSASEWVYNVMEGDLERLEEQP